MMVASIAPVATTQALPVGARIEVDDAPSPRAPKAVRPIESQAVIVPVIGPVSIVMLRPLMVAPSTLADWSLRSPPIATLPDTTPWTNNSASPLSTVRSA